MCIRDRYQRRVHGDSLIEMQIKPAFALISAGINLFFFVLWLTDMRFVTLLNFVIVASVLLYIFVVKFLLFVYGESKRKDLEVNFFSVISAQTLKSFYFRAYEVLNDLLQLLRSIILGKNIALTLKALGSLWLLYKIAVIFGDSFTLLLVSNVIVIYGYYKEELKVQFAGLLQLVKQNGLEANLKRIEERIPRYSNLKRE
eukprot:TRINITY_DN2902_c0_g2_i3.p1 TRINITY_DN2902_c0_g2~~TRINITY_DN2902_c0_g2_i3.p1  ORF type:complete len:229 (-),score=51.34 TRINITY_DN2902_c0_g2_i3:164-763(-)